jgi:NAD(P)-dependent dehydrogenase (short-subunit alcohol dehydrogenase family)
MKTCFKIVFLFCIWSVQIFANPVVLVTGASRGIGYAIANLLAHEKYTVYAGVRETSSLKLVTEAREQNPEHFHIISLDVTDQKSVDQAIQTIYDKEGRIDVLINNAGVVIVGSVENVTIEEAEKVFNVNFFGMMRVTQAVLPFMRAQQQGHIIQISSRSSFCPLPSLSVYAASKFAMEGLSETIAALLKPSIKVSLIEPGPVDTELDVLAPYGSRLPRDQDPYYSIFEKAGLLDPTSPIMQQAEEIALLVKNVIESENPHFRYQTQEVIRGQAARRFVDITGDSHVDEWDALLRPTK